VDRFKDAQHLLRLAGVFFAGFALFLLMRHVLVPRSFGQYGHFRGNALAEIATHPINYAGHKPCEDCHVDIVEVKNAGKHIGVNCEACHGPQEKHVVDPGEVVPKLPDTAVLCPRCHEANLAKPLKFPQVDSKDHSGGQPCKTCHQPHSPLLISGEKKS